MNNPETTLQAPAAGSPTPSRTGRRTVWLWVVIAAMAVAFVGFGSFVGTFGLVFDVIGFVLLLVFVAVSTLRRSGAHSNAPIQPSD